MSDQHGLFLRTVEELKELAISLIELQQQICDQLCIGAQCELYDRFQKLSNKIQHSQNAPIPLLVLTIGQLASIIQEDANHDMKRNDTRSTEMMKRFLKDHDIEITWNVNP